MAQNFGSILALLCRTCHSSTIGFDAPGFFSFDPEVWALAMNAGQGTAYPWPSKGYTFDVCNVGLSLGAASKTLGM